MKHRDQNFSCTQCLMTTMHKYNGMKNDSYVYICNRCGRTAVYSRNHRRTYSGRFNEILDQTK